MWNQPPPQVQAEKKPSPQKLLMVYVQIKSAYLISRHFTWCFQWAYKSEAFSLSRKLPAETEKKSDIRY